VPRTWHPVRDKVGAVASTEEDNVLACHELVALMVLIVAVRNPHLILICLSMRFSTDQYTAQNYPRNSDNSPGTLL